MTYLADKDEDHPLASQQAASCIYRIALGPRSGWSPNLQTPGVKKPGVTH